VVNFDHSLGTAVNKVREALGDSAENPHYIETLANADTGSLRRCRYWIPRNACKVECRCRRGSALTFPD